MPDERSRIPNPPDTPPDTVPEAQPQELTPSIAAVMFGASDGRTLRGAWQPPSPEELQRDFPQYEIRGILGRGGMGAVYKGWQKSLDRFVAIKILPPGFDDGLAGFTERFKREAKAMAQLKHPGIVAVHDAGETASGLLYFIMECVEGTDVHQLVKERGRLEPAEALRITTAVCDALGYAHEHGIVHRDIKPSNVMLDADGTVKVADFGLAKTTAAETTQLTMSNVTMGTPDFMAPESHFGTAQVDHRADLYAVGVMLYQMLTGQLPKGRFDPPSRIVPGLDRRLDAIVDKALRTDREQRYGTATELCTALTPVLAKLGGPRSSARVSPASDAPRSARGARRSTLAAAAIASIAITVVAYFKPWRNAEGPSAPSALSPSAVSQVPSLPPASSARKWTKAFTKAEDLPEQALAKGVRWKDGWIDGSAADSMAIVNVTDVAGAGPRGRNRGIRLHGKIVAGAKKSAVILSTRRFSPGAAARDDRYQFSLDLSAAPAGRIGLLLSAKPIGANVEQLLSYPLETPLAPGSEFDMEFLTIGDKLIGRLNGRTLPIVTDSRLTEGYLGFQTGHLIRDIEVIDLDGLSEAEALKAAGLPPSTPAAEPWANALAKPEDAVLVGAQNTARGLELAVQGQLKLKIEKGPRRDGAMRMKSIFDPAASGLHLRLRCTLPKDTGHYRLALRDAGHAELRRVDLQDKTGAILADYALPAALQPGQEYEMELRVVGTRLTAKLNGAVLGQVEDTVLTEGQFGVGNSGTTPALVQSLEYLDLDAGRAALPSSPPATTSPAPAVPPGK